MSTRNLILTPFEKQYCITCMNRECKKTKKERDVCMSDKILALLAEVDD